MPEEAFGRAAYALMTSAGWDGDDALTSVLDALVRDDRSGADLALGLQIGYTTARLRMLISLRSALGLQDLKAIEQIVTRDSSDIDDWPDPLER
jgi:hypothetical protein